MYDANCFLKSASKRSYHRKFHQKKVWIITFLPAWRYINLKLDQDYFNNFAERAQLLTKLESEGGLMNKEIAMFVAGAGYLFCVFEIMLLTFYNVFI